MTVPYDAAKEQLLDAALPHVAFDGWSETTFKEAMRDSELSATVARAVCPRGAVDLAVAFHKRGDAAMVARLETEDMSDLKFREKITRAVQIRLEVAGEDKEAVRRGATLFALPMHAADGAKLVWGTCDLIWTALGDTSDDINWYSKRATLAGVYSSTVLYWLGDNTPGHQATWAFLDRRISDVMQIEKIKANVRKSPTLSRLLAGPNYFLSRIKAPRGSGRDDLPGRWTPPQG